MKYIKGYLESIRHVWLLLSLNVLVSATNLYGWLHMHNILSLVGFLAPVVVVCITIIRYAIRLHKGDIIKC